MRAPVLARLRHRLLRRQLPVWYSPAYRLPLSGVESGTGIEPRRADYVAWWLVDSACIRASDLRAPARIAYADLDRVHTPELLESLARPEALGHVFAVDPSDVPVDEILSMVRLGCGGTLAAAREALARRGPTLNLLGGFHHAAPAVAGGFCPVNDVAVAVAALRAEGFGGRVVVLDLDAHPPDGTAACLRDDPSAWIGSLSGSDWGPIPTVDETVLHEGADDELYLEVLSSLLARMPRPALAFVLAGGDVLAGDRFGRLGLTLPGVRRRDLEVARALAGVPSVWLPGGGYHRDAWRVLAGTGTVLATGSQRAIPNGYDPLSARFTGISAELTPSDLGEVDLTAADIEEALGLAPGRRVQRLWLDYYTAAGLEHALYRYGILDHLRRLGYSGFRVELGGSDAGDRMRLFGHAGPDEHVLLELVAERRRVLDRDVLYVHWLSLRDPRSRFSAKRPRLPGQDVPGLGIAREIGELLGIVARRLQLAGVVFRPAYLHTAYSARHGYSFVDPIRQGRFEALLRDLSALPLRDATEALATGRVRLDGAPYTWEADEMVVWLDPANAPARHEDVARERERCRFEVVGRP